MRQPWWFSIYPSGTPLHGNPGVGCNYFAGSAPLLLTGSPHYGHHVDLDCSFWSVFLLIHPSYLVGVDLPRDLVPQDLGGSCSRPTVGPDRELNTHPFLGWFIGSVFRIWCYSDNVQGFCPFQVVLPLLWVDLGRWVLDRWVYELHKSPYFVILFLTIPRDCIPILVCF